MADMRFSAERLDLLMAQMQISSLELARRTGLSKTMIYYLRTGQRRSASAENATKIADALGTTLDYLLGEGKEDSPPAADLPILLHELTEVAKRLPNRRQRDLLLMARAYLDASEVAATDPDALMEGILDLVNEAGGIVSRDQLIAYLDKLDDDSISGALPLLPHEPQ